MIKRRIAEMVRQSLAKQVVVISENELRSLTLLKRRMHNFHRSPAVWPSVDDVAKEYDPRLGAASLRIFVNCR